MSPYFQSTWMFDDETVRLILPYAAQKLNVAKLGLLTEVSDLGAALGASIKKEWSRLGKELSIEESFQSKETNFRPSLLKILATKPDAIYNTSSNGSCRLRSYVRRANLATRAPSFRTVHSKIRNPRYR